MFDIETSQGWPMPVLDDLNRPLFEGMKEGKVMVQKCADCNTWLAPSAFICEACGSENVPWVEVSGKGELYTYVVYHRAYAPEFESMVPYNVALIELEEGPRLLANIVGIANEDLQIGMALKPVFQEVAEGLPLLRFEPA
ncbi:MAG: hypothetical protein DRQ60_03855 [Gammaproteobacteria bacterium]|nr:MAG: hypothetical protein DRQ54_00670 [Gammaproteobacteria bacterium]RLA15853.1 MAG: hypothetical protein DRQ52_00815 [Gammaproteobacteria bacterium]RLA16697.1 MAG: hypothetical protein DRQ60_03855 [Gammaproteobacteria bacterium]